MSLHVLRCSAWLENYAPFYLAELLLITLLGVFVWRMLWDFMRALQPREPVVHNDSGSDGPERDRRVMNDWGDFKEIFECILSWRMASKMIFQVRLAGRWLRNTHQICHFPLLLKECTHHQIQFIFWVLLSSEYSSGASQMFTMLSHQSAFMLLSICRQQHLRHVSASNYIEKVQFVGYTL